ncbi:hypothetical protein [Butyrivibrio proteoclasticus]|uniref:hypothetical protein n=1 Tax=Butyrivibrio proteoclasticus TaxID=43305 RepID=UPI00047DC3CB|nr:hypothetical protein [Butyrivibrio proteoclasticus]
MGVFWIGITMALCIIEFGIATLCLMRKKANEDEVLKIQRLCSFIILIAIAFALLAGFFTAFLILGRYYETLTYMDVFSSPIILGASLSVSIVFVQVFVIPALLIGWVFHPHISRRK